MSDMDVMCWLPHSDKVSTPKEQRDIALGYITDFIEPWDELGFGVWAVCIRDTRLGTLGSFIGYCGFLPAQFEGAGPEVAYAIGKSMWGKRLVTEALIACLDWIFIKPKIFTLLAYSLSKSLIFIRKKMIDDEAFFNAPQ